MRLIGKQKLEKLKRKNSGNLSLTRDIDTLINDIEKGEWKSQTELKVTRPDADCVHSEGFYFFNIAINRTMILIEFEDGEANVVWVGNHQKYVTSMFVTNTNTDKNSHASSIRP